MNPLLSDALADGAAAPTSQGDLLSMLLPFGLVAGLYFLMIHPQVKRQKEHKKMVDAIGKGDEVITSGGLVGRIMELKDDFLTLEIAPQIQVKIRRVAVETVLPKGSIKEL